jgi:hypothetical protein
MGTDISKESVASIVTVDKLGKTADLRKLKYTFHFPYKFVLNIFIINIYGITVEIGAKPRGGPLL